MESPEHRTRSIREYVELESESEVVHLERLAVHRVYDDDFDVWDVRTADQERWWVISNPTNLYSHNEVPSMDVALSLHLGLRLRIFARRTPQETLDELERFARTWRKVGQAQEALEDGKEAEDFQAVGMRCREALLAFAREFSDAVTPSEGEPAPKVGDFKGWAQLAARELASSRFRTYLQTISAAGWDYVSEVTHMQNATRSDAKFAVDVTEQIVSILSMAILRAVEGDPERCPECGSYRLVADWRSELAHAGEPANFILCEVCGWEEARDPQSLENWEPPLQRPETVEPPWRPAPPVADECSPSTLNTFITPEEFERRARFD